MWHVNMSPVWTSLHNYPIIATAKFESECDFAVRQTRVAERLFALPQLIKHLSLNGATE